MRGLYGGPLRFQDFRDPLPSFAISAVIGLAAGLVTADDAGRRYLIAVAAAVQFAIYPVWVGIAIVGGFPDRHTTAQRLEVFALNVFTIAASAIASYRFLGMRRKQLQPFLDLRRRGQ